VVADLSEMVFKAKEKLCQRKLDSVKMRFATFPQNGEMPHGSAVQISSLSRVDYGDRWKMLRALSAFE
jgi:hypothetical protein